jgi:hypothetical protein
MKMRVPEAIGSFPHCNRSVDNWNFTVNLIDDKRANEIVRFNRLGRKPDCYSVL